MADYYGRRSVVGLPPERVLVATRHRTFVAHDRSIYVDIYVFNDTEFVRLRDLAYLLQDAFHVISQDGQERVEMGARYMPIGGEASPPALPHGTARPAHLHSHTLLIDDAAEQVLSYRVDGEIFYHLSYLAGALGFRLSRDGDTVTLIPADL